MDDEDKVESLRDTFEEVTGETKVREEGGVDRGVLKSDEEVKQSVEEVVLEVEENHGVPADVDVVVDLIFSYFEGRGDGEIAEAIDVDVEEVESMRRSVCLLRDDEDPSEDTRMRDKEGRYSVRLDSLFPESDITGRLTEGVEESGLREATEDSEVDTEF